MEETVDPISTQLSRVNAEEANSILESRADLSYRLFEGANLRGAVARQSIFPGSLFRRCVIQDCDFSRSDFEGTRFEQCTFKNVSFEDADIRSTHFADCQLEDCSFVGSYFSRNVISGGVVADCQFDRSTILHNEFNSCIIRRLSNQIATILHTDFVKASFEDVSLANCTCLYSYFEDCIYDGFEINVDAIGLSFGLTEAAVEKTKLVFLGRGEAVPPDGLIVEGLLREFDRRRWLLHAALAQLNFSLVQPLAGWIAIFDVFIKEATQKRIVKADDIAFVTHLAERMAKRHRLPMFAVIAAYDQMIGVSVSHSSTEPSSTDALSEMRANLLELLNVMEESYSQGAAAIAGIGTEIVVTAELRFSERPSEAVAPFLQMLSDASHISKSHVRQLGSRSGSWIEIVSTSLATMLALYAALYLVEGYLVRLTFIRARLTVLMKAQVPKSYLARARDPTEDPTREMLQVLGSVYSAMLKGTVSIPSSSEIIGRNLREIKLTRQDDPTS